MRIKFPSSKTIATACAILLIGTVAAAAADDQAQAQVCRRMLDAVAAGNPDRAADIMLLEGQPAGLQVSKESEANLKQMRALTRTALEGALQRNGGTRPQARKPLPERHFGERIAVIERWDLGNGHKAYIGCVRFPRPARLDDQCAGQPGSIIRHRQAAGGGRRQALSATGEVTRGGADALLHARTRARPLGQARFSRPWKTRSITSRLPS